MKKGLLFLLLSTLIAVSSFAKKVDGTIIFMNDSSLNVTFRIPTKLLSGEVNFLKLQYGVKFYDFSGKKVTIRPDRVKEIRFRDEGEEIRMLSRRDNLGGGGLFSNSDYIFLKLEIDGPLKLFSYYYQQQSGMGYGPNGMMTGGGSYEVEKQVLQKYDEELIWPKGLSFKKQMVEYFADCPVIARKIQEKEFRRRDIKLIVSEYNNRCGQ